MARPSQFRLDISEALKKINELHDVFLRKLTLQIAYKLIYKSPVGNPDLWKSPPPPGYVGGRFRNNIQMSDDCLSNAGDGRGRNCGFARRLHWQQYLARPRDTTSQRACASRKWRR